MRRRRTAAIVGADGTTVQHLVTTLVARWRASGTNVVGMLAEAHGMADRNCSVGFLRDIVSRKLYPIYLEKAPSHTSCHINAGGVARACAAVLDQISTSDLVVLSKFGKLEVSHEGLGPAFAAAIAAGKPVLTTVSDRYYDAWRTFAPDATLLAADQAEIEAW